MRKTLCFLFPILVALNVWAQGEIQPLENQKELAKEAENKSEEKPAVPSEGPHQGILVPAGNFQLELIWQEDLSLKIYLLDAEYKNETVQNSEVGVFIQSGNVESEMSCHPVENLFECKQSGKKFKKGTLAISSKRNGNQAEEVKVKLPFEKKSAEKDKKIKDIKKKK